MEPIVIQATFNKATTTVDSGWRLSFDTGEEMSEACARLSKMRDQVLYVVVMNQAQFSLSQSKD